MNVKENGDDVSVTYEDCIINVNECSKILKRRGLGPINSSVLRFYKTQEQHEARIQNGTPKKVTRKNKHAGLRIIAGTLILSTIVAVTSKMISENDDIDVSDDLSYSQSNDELAENNIIIINEDKLNVVETNDDFEVFISFQDRSDTERAYITRAYYGSTIEKYSKMYGVDPKILLAIATQERGIHSEKKDPSGATGLMQIENEVWIGEKLTAYNYDTGQYDSVIVTEEDLADVFKNIKYGCMIFQNCMDYMDDNVLAAIQCYNMGCGNMDKIFKSYSAEIGKDVQDILSDFSDYGWLEHRDIISVGDQKYLEHVLSWIGSEINLESIDESANTVSLRISNESKEKSISYN